MDRRIAQRVGVLGAGLILVSGGCSSMRHRVNVPPAPRAMRDGGQAQFNSAPNPAVGGMVQPSGPISNGIGANGSAGLYGTGPGSTEIGNAPLGEPTQIPGTDPSAAGSAPPPK